MRHKELRVAVANANTAMWIMHKICRNPIDLPAYVGHEKRDQTSVTRARPDTCPKGMSENARAK